MGSIDRDRIGVCSWSLKPQDPVDLVQQLADLKLSVIQLALSPLREANSPWAQAHQVLAGAAVRIISGMFGTTGEDYSTLDTIRATGGVVPDGHWPANQRIAADAAEIAESLGVRIVSFHAGFIPHRGADGYPTLLARLRTLAHLYGQRKMELLFETGQETADDLLALLEDLNMPNVGVNFDPANMILYDKGEPIESLRKLLPYVRQVHVKDAIRTTTPGQWGRETSVGQGEVDWPAFKQTLEQGGYRGAYIIEREAGPNRVADVQQAIDVLLE